MPRNRRNTRRIRSIKEVLTTKTFLTIVGILLLVITTCIVINSYKQYQDKQLLAKQKTWCYLKKIKLLEQGDTQIVPNSERFVCPLVPILHWHIGLNYI